MTWFSEYAPGCNYGKVLNIPGFLVCQVSAYASIAKVLDMPEYGWIMPYITVLNMHDQYFTGF